MAESFRHRDANVTLVEKLPRLLPSMSAVIGDMVVAELQAAGVDIRTGRGLARGRRCWGDIGERRNQSPADLVLLAIGVVRKSSLRSMPAWRLDQLEPSRSTPR